VAKEVLDRLRAENRTKEADEFLAALDEAVQRDCVAIVTYTGDAEIDLLIEEPTGAICSLRNPRTITGGVMLGDAIDQIGQDSQGGQSEVYVCPKGFDGTYRLLVRRVWGHVTDDKINVEVITHFRAANSIRERKKISLDSDELMVVFDLKDGRRKEALHDQQLANAVGGQLAVNRQILAQQLDSSVDTDAVEQMSLARSSENGARNNTNPFFANGAVGYQPIIQTFPEGASLTVTAVASHDRRYVRVTPYPFFSQIGNVVTFNTSTGATGSSSGGSGGQGFSGASGGSGSTGSTGSSGSTTH